MMINIRDLNQFEEETKDTELFCLMFGRRKSPTCIVMTTVLNEVNRKRDYKCLYLDVSIQKFYKLILAYNVSVLPKYVFINQGNIIYEGVGTDSKRNIETGLKKEGV